MSTGTGSSTGNVWGGGRGGAGKWSTVNETTNGTVTTNGTDTGAQNDTSTGTGSSTCNVWGKGRGGVGVGLGSGVQ